MCQRGVAVVVVRRSAVWGGLMAALLVPLASCANSGLGESLQDSLAADPRLRETNPTSSPSPELAPEAQAELPTNFPTAIPRYPNAALQEVIPAEAGAANAEVSTVWRTLDGSDRVFAFYREQLQTNGWKILEAPLTNDQGTLVAQRDTPDGLKVTVAIAPALSVPSPSPETSPSPTPTGTKFTLRYIPPTEVGQASPSPAASPSPSPNVSPSPSPQQLETNLGLSGTSEGVAIAPPAIALSPNSYTDVNQAPSYLQPFVTELAQLGVLNLSETEKAKSGATNFLPNKPVSRREFARWLFAANNQLYRDRPAQQIRSGNREIQSAFRDVPTSDPDFAAIQGLAEAGIIPSALSGNATEVLFRPDAQLSRETMLLWKVPMDTRQPLPAATLDAIKQTWGFQDAARIDPTAQRAVLADYQNADLSNVRRVFGFTTLFQPKRPVSRAEAAAALWHFGYQGDGVTAREALKAQAGQGAGSNN